MNPIKETFKQLKGGRWAELPAIPTPSERPEPPEPLPELAKEYGGRLVLLCAAHLEEPPDLVA